jgi:CheY-like chemotaxis protein
MVAADAAQLESAILNLAVNARDAMPDGGVLRFSTRILDGAPNLPPGPCVELSVSDTGQGIEPDLQSRIWEPFFTTKAPGRGTGLGLAAVHGTVHSHGGHIELESRVGTGSVFRIYLPRIQATAPTPERSEPKVPNGRGHLLVVDDEAMVRDTVTRLLESLGYTATAFGSGAEAVAYYRDHAQEVDATILDLVMPDMNGVETAARLKDIRPDALILIASGYNPLDADALGKIGAAAFMPKPYSRRELAQRLQVLLEHEEA